MSFYGSVYYQLIDTFYKIVIKNGGDSTFTFNPTDNQINPSDTELKDIIESAAIGRKGVFSLDSGNYWINFSRADDVDEIAPYKIWHSEPHNDEETRKRVSGWDIETEEYESIKDDYGYETSVVLKGTDTPLIEGEDYIQLKEHEFLRIYPTHYDEAGHIIGETSESILYRLPSVNISERLSALEGMIGEPKIAFPRPDLPDDVILNMTPEQLAAYEGDYIYNLANYAEENYRDIKLLEKYVGDWSQSYGSYEYNNESLVTISNWIGNLDKLYVGLDSSSTFFSDLMSTGVWDNDLEKMVYTPTTLVDIIGPAKRIWDEYVAEENIQEFLTPDGNGIPRKVGLADAIYSNRLKLLTTMAELHEVQKLTLTHTNQINKLNNVVGLDLADDRVVFTEIDKLIAKDIALDAMDAQIIKDYIAADGVLRSEFKAADEQIIKDYSAADERIIESYSAADAQIIKNYEAADNALDLKITNLNTTHSNDIKNLRTDLGTREDNQKSVFIEIADLHNLVSNLRSDVGTNSGESTVFAQLAAHQSAIDNFTTVIGSPSGDSIFGQLNSLFDEVSGIKNTIGVFPSTLNGTICTVLENVVVVEIPGIKADISGIKSDIASAKTTIGTHTTAIETLNTNIDNIEKDVSDNAKNIENIGVDIQTINTTLGTFEGNIGTINESIEGIEQSIGDLESENAKIYKILGDDFATDQGQNITNALKDISDSIEGIIDDVTEINGDIDTINNETISGINGNISGLTERVGTIELNITKIQSAISELQTVILSLHPDSEVEFNFTMNDSSEEN